MGDLLGKLFERAVVVDDKISMRRFFGRVKLSFHAVFIIFWVSACGIKITFFCELLIGNDSDNQVEGMVAFALVEEGNFSNKKRLSLFFLLSPWKDRFTIPNHPGGSSHCRRKWGYLF